VCIKKFLTIIAMEKPKFCFIKPLRLVWREGKEKPAVSGYSGPEILDKNTRELMEKVQKDLDRVVVEPPGGEGDESLYTLDKFVEEHRDLLAGSFDLYSLCGMSLFRRGAIEKFEDFRKYFEHGYIYLDSKISSKDRRAYVANAFDNLYDYLTVTEAGYKGDNFYGRNPDVAVKAHQDVVAFAEAFVKNEKLAQVLDTDPVALAMCLRRVGKRFPDVAVKGLADKVKSFDMSDDDFYKVLCELGATEKGAKVYPFLVRLLLDSKEKSFTNLPLFADRLGILGSALYLKKNEANGDVLLLVLRRGRHFIEQDAQTKEKVGGIVRDYLGEDVKLEDLMKGM